MAPKQLIKIKVVENWEVEEGTYLYGFTIVDLQGNEYFTDFIEISYDE